MVNCRDYPTESCPMSDEQDRTAQRTRMMEIWHETAGPLTLLCPRSSLTLRNGNQTCRGWMKRGVPSPPVLKHWEQLFPTKEFLRQRYAEHHILEGPSLWSLLQNALMMTSDRCRPSAEDVILGS